VSIILAEPTNESSSESETVQERPARLVPIQERMGPGRFPGFWKPIRSAFWFLHVAFGTGCLVLILAILAAIPGLNVLTLGYLLDPQRRVAESGRLRDGFPLLVLAPRLGVIVLFSILFLIPVRIQALRVSDAAVILGATHERVVQMHSNLLILQAIVAIHLILAIARAATTAGSDLEIRLSISSLIRANILNGTVSCFFRPIRNVRWFLRTTFTRAGRDEMFAGIEQVMQVIKPVHHFWIGLKAFFGAVVWLFIPAGLLVAYSAPGRTSPIFGVLSFLGVVLMIPVAAWLPMLQVHQVVVGRFRAIFSVSAARHVIRHAPLSWMLTTVLMYVMTFPLYLAKIKLLPADALLVLTPFFIILTYPARVLVAWAYHRGMNRTEPAWRPLRWGVRLVMLPLLAAYAAFLFLTPFVSELGKAAPLENQAFLGPVPYAQWARK